MEEIKPFRFLLTFQIIGLDNFHLTHLSRIGKIKIVKAEPKIGILMYGCDCINALTQL